MVRPLAGLLAVRLVRSGQSESLKHMLEVRVLEVMFSPLAFCSECGDEFDPIEGQRPSDDPADQSNFCSDDCYDRYHDAIDAQSAYDEAGWAAPVF